MITILATLALLASNALEHPAPGTAPWQAAPEKKASVLVLDDQLRPAPGTVIEFTDGGSTGISAVTDANGQTPWLSLDPSSGMLLILGESLTPNGILLGSIEVSNASPLPDNGENSHLWEIARTMFLATPVSLVGMQGDSANFWPPRGVYPHWRIALPVNSTLRCNAHVATLMDGEAVSEYAAYRGLQLDPTTYVRGVVLVLPSVQLGVDGLDLSVCLHGDLAGLSVEVDAYSFARNKVRLVGRKLEVKVRGVINDMVVIGIRGTVPAGHLALFVRSSASGPGKTQMLLDSPPDITVPSGSSGSSSARVGVVRESHPPRNLSGETAGARNAPQIGGEETPFSQECEPPVPTLPAWTCVPGSPSTTCTGAFPHAATECGITRLRTDLFCRPDGATHTQTKENLTRFKTAYEASGSVPLVLKTTGGFEYGTQETSITTDSWTAPAGALGLGQCTRYFLFYLDCTQEWCVFADKEIRQGWFGNVEIHPCARVKYVKTFCQDRLNSQTVCDRTP